MIYLVYGSSSGEEPQTIFAHPCRSMRRVEEHTSTMPGGCEIEDKEAKGGRRERRTLEKHKMVNVGRRTPMGASGGKMLVATHPIGAAPPNMQRAVGDMFSGGSWIVGDSAVMVPQTFLPTGAESVPPTRGAAGTKIE